MNTGVTVIGAEAPSAYHVAPRTETPSQNQAAGSPALTAASPVSVELAGTTGKKKRGRPRKYGPDGTVTMALSPMPISSSAPPGGDLSATKRGKVRPSGLEYKQHKKVGMQNFGIGFFYIIVLLIQHVACCFSFESIFLSIITKRLSPFCCVDRTQALEPVS